MPRKVRELGALAVRNLKEPGLHFVGQVPGLALQVLPTGGKTWILRLMVGGRRRDMGFGGYPEVSLQDARNAARKARERVREGIDPIGERRVAQLALRSDGARGLTFKDAAEGYIAAHEAGWKNQKHRQQWQNSLACYAYPVLGWRSVGEIELPQVLEVLDPIWTTKTETASRLRGRLELVLDWAAARGHRKGLNPARWRGHLGKLLARPSKVAKVEHHRSLRPAEVSAFMQRLRNLDGIGSRALEFAILTGSRSGEARGANWSEIGT